MRVRFWPRRPDVESVESRYPAGTRTGEGADSVLVFVEAERKSRVHEAPPPAVAIRSAKAAGRKRPASVPSRRAAGR